MSSHKTARFPGSANAFVACLEVLGTVFGHLTCLSSFSQLYSEVSSDPITLEALSTSTILLLSISGHNSCLSYSLPSPLSHNLGCITINFSIANQDGALLMEEVLWLAKPWYPVSGLL